MNKEYIITTAFIVLAFLVLGGIILSRNNDDTQPTAEAEVVEEITSEQSEDQMQRDEVSVKDEMVQMPETAVKYVLSDGSEVSYTVQKRFLQKEDDVVVGTTTEITGSGWFDVDSAAGALDVSLDFADLSTGNDKRDADVAKMLNDTTIDFHTDISSIEKAEDGAFKKQVLADLSINGVTETVTFDVVGVVVDGKFTADGTTTIMMSDFDINPPSIAGIYTVDDELELSFKVSGVSTSE